MIRIIHISDFHLNKENLSDWKTYTKKAFIDLVNETRNNDGVVPFIVCTGDLVDKGGADLGIEDSLKLFRNEVIVPILEGTELSADRFIIVPGNHDISRNLDKEYEVLGLRALFKEKGSKAINQFVQDTIETGDFHGINRILPYKNFEKELYAGLNNVDTSFWGTTFKFTQDGVTIGFSGLDSSWNAYDDNDKINGLEISEPQYNKCKQSIENCDIKIALAHHPLDWFSYEKETISNWIYEDYDIFCCGHVHETDTSMISKPYGTLFVDIAPSFTNEIRDSVCGAFANGLTVIDYEPSEMKVDCYYYAYRYKQRRYTLNEDKVQNGCFSCFITKNTENNTLKGIMESSIKYICENQYPIINSSLIPNKAKVLNSLKDAFVLPPITQHGDDGQTEKELQEILNNSSNIILFGQHESGKTVLLNRMIIEVADHFKQYGIVPVYIDFAQLGNRDIESFVRDYLGLNSKEAKILIESRKLLLFVDNYNPIQENQFQARKLYNFLRENCTKIIATCNTEIPGTIPNSFANGYNQIAFELYLIMPFKSSNIRELMSKWHPEFEFGKRMENMDKLVSNFTSYSLPCTPMSISLYLWSREERHREPINKAVLLDIYISIILDRLSPSNVYQNTFDYKNRTMLISHIAYRMDESKKFSIEYDVYISIIREYLSKVGFTKFVPEKLGNYYIERKVFVKRDGKVAFAHSCFYNYFLAQRMIDNIDFRKKVLTADNFYHYEQTIDYYGGLVRNDTSLLKFIHQQFTEMFAPVQQARTKINYDEMFTYIVKNKKNENSIAGRINVGNIKNNKPKEEDVERRLDAIHDKELENITDKLNTNVIKSPSLLIIMLATALRNLDGVEDFNLKCEIYSDLIKNSLLYTAITKNGLAIYANSHNGQLPGILNNIRNVESFLRFMPLSIQSALGSILNTTKLNSVFKEKVSSDKKEKVSDIESFLTIGMLWDSSNLENKELVERFIKKCGKNVALDYVFTKLYWYYITRVKKGSKEEKDYLHIFATIQSHGYLIPSLKRLHILKNINNDK